METDEGRGEEKEMVKARTLRFNGNAIAQNLT